MNTFLNIYWEYPKFSANRFNEIASLIMSPLHDKINSRGEREQGKYYVNPKRYSRAAQNHFINVHYDSRIRKINKHA